MVIMPLWGMEPYGKRIAEDQIMQAVNNEDIKELQSILKQNPHLFREGKIGWLALLQAVYQPMSNENRRLKMIKMLINAGVDVYPIRDDIFLHLLTSRQQYSPYLIGFFLDLQDARGNRIIDVNRRLGLDESALHLAQNAHTIRLLLRAGALINVQDMRGLTPLHEAINQIDLEKVKILLQAGADTTIHDFDPEECALELAQRNYLSLHNGLMLPFAPNYMKGKSMRDKAELKLHTLIEIIKLLQMYPCSKDFLRKDS